MFDLAAVQAVLQEFACDGWLLYDFRGSNVLARRILDLADRPIGSRRFFYFVPARGAPTRLVHRIETGALDHLPGEKVAYLRWQELEERLRQIIGSARRVAMEYAPRGGNPYVSRVDAGTVELIRSFGAEVVSSADLIQTFEATWSDEQWRLHQQAAAGTEAAYTKAYAFIEQRLQAGRTLRELEVQQLILDHFQQCGLTTSHPPIVGVGPHAGDPHYEPTPDTNSELRAGDLVLIDLWAKVNAPQAVYSDLTQMAFLGPQVPERMAQVFAVVAQARDRAIARVREAFARQEPLFGWQVDDAARGVIEAAGFGDYFIHRTGHSIGQETHGNGANMDNLETHDERRVIPRTCFSIEPGIYFPEFGVRSETNVFVDRHAQVHVTGGPLQTEIRRLQV